MKWPSESKWIRPNLPAMLKMSANGSSPAEANADIYLMARRLAYTSESYVSNPLRQPSVATLIIYLSSAISNHLLFLVLPVPLERGILALFK